MRVDVFLVEKGFAKTRAKAEEMIERGFVMVNNLPIHKKNKDIKEGDAVIITGKLRYVSRGGDKLEGALLTTKLTVTGLTCLDIGSSTGGFTDCLVQHGAKHVTAVDVGTGQFDANLSQDEKVSLFEKTDIRQFVTEKTFDLLVGDISFISWEKVIDAVNSFTRNGTKVLFLIKPQFEVGREHIGRGIVLDEELQKKVCSTLRTLFSEHGYANIEIFPSELVGGDGNKEFFLYGQKI